MMPGTFWAESEFDGEAGTCGPNGYAMARCWGEQKYIGQPAPGKTATSVVYRAMRAAGRCKPSGVATDTAIFEQALADKFRAGMWDKGAWLDYLKAGFAETAVAVVLVNRGAKMRDAITGAGEDAGPSLAGHFWMAAEYHPGGMSARAGRVLPEGIFTADGDSDVNNPVVGGKRTRRVADHHLTFAALETLKEANPVSIIRIYPKVPFGPVYATPSGLPGWRDTAGGDPDQDGELLAPSGLKVVRGFRAYVLREARAGRWDAHNSPIENERAVSQVEQWNTAHGAGSVQTFHDCRLCYTPASGVYRMWLGDEALYLEHLLASAKAAA
jgi:hypothetical protein